MLSWTKLSPTVKLINTKKKFFNEFLFKILVYAPGCRETVFCDDAITAIKNRRDALNSYYFVHAKQEKLKMLDSSDLDQLQYFIDARKFLGDTIKFRIEEPILTVYSNDINLLYKMAIESRADRIIEVHQPKNIDAVQSLDHGYIISKIANEFSYKIIFRETWSIDQETKLQIKNYLYNLETDIKMTNSVKSFLNSQHRYGLNGYIYAKDDRIITFLDMIYPGLVSKIYKLTDQGL